MLNDTIGLPRVLQITYFSSFNNPFLYLCFALFLVNIIDTSNADELHGWFECNIKDISSIGSVSLPLDLRIYFIPLPLNKYRV